VPKRERGAAFDSAEDWYRAAAGMVLRRLREAHGWSYREFGEKAGAAHTTLYVVERGEATPGIDLLERVAEAGGLTLTALLTLIVDEMHAARLLASVSGGAAGVPLADVVEAAADLTPSQRAELLAFIDYLRFRDRESES
jgi:transcriptional regulator with XRE-family HTH domain